MRNSWVKEANMEENIWTFSEAAKIWNKEVFGHILRKKNRLTLCLEGISNKLSFQQNIFLEKLHKVLWKELEAILIQE